MTEVISAELRLLKKAQDFVAAKGASENPKITKLFRRVAGDPQLWVDLYRILFSNLSWASEMCLLGLNREEATAVATMLRSMKIEGIQLNSPEGYKALGLSGVQRYVASVHGELQALKKTVETRTHTLIRFDKRGIVSSGYKRGFPITTYITAENHYHKIYLDKEGRFQVVNRALETRLPRDNELFLMAIQVEKAIPEMKQAWDIWKREQSISLRVTNLEKFSDAQGAFA